MTNEQNAPAYEATRDKVAKAIADAIGHGMAEKCYTHADAAISVLSSPPAAGDAVAWLVTHQWPDAERPERNVYFKREIAEQESRRYTGVPGEVTPLFASPAAPPSVTDAMVEAALDVYVTPSETLPFRSILRERMRDALEAALTHPGHKHAQEDAAQEGAIPARVYYSVEHDNFYCNDTLKGMGTPFYMKWHARRREFPTLRSEGDTE